jgi:hypothetical protein
MPSSMIRSPFFCLGDLPRNCRDRVDASLAWQEPARSFAAINGVRHVRHRARRGRQRCASFDIFVEHGWNIGGGVAQPKPIVERIDFNGDGTLVSPFATVSINGVIIHSSHSVGSYTVEASGQGTLTFTGGPSFDIFVEHGDGKQLWMIHTAPTAVPAVFEGTATKVSK